MPHAELLRRHADAFAEVLGEGALVAEGVGAGDVIKALTAQRGSTQLPLSGL